MMNSIEEIDLVESKSSKISTNQLNVKNQKSELTHELDSEVL